MEERKESWSTVLPDSERRRVTRALIRPVPIRGIVGSERTKLRALHEGEGA